MELRTGVDKIPKIRVCPLRMIQGTGKAVSIALSSSLGTSLAHHQVMRFCGFSPSLMYQMVLPRCHLVLTLAPRKWSALVVSPKCGPSRRGRGRGGLVGGRESPFNAATPSLSQKSLLDLCPIQENGTSLWKHIRGLEHRTRVQLNDTPNSSLHKFAVSLPSA